MYQGDELRGGGMQQFSSVKKEEVDDIRFMGDKVGDFMDNINMAAASPEFQIYQDEMRN